MTSSRVILAPQGLPTDERAREAGFEFLVRVGGDLSRLFDRPSSDLGAFVSHVSGARDLRDGVEPAVFLLWRLLPIAALVALREDVERRLPAVACAPWLLLADPIREPGVFQRFAEIGSLDRSAWEAPVWTGPRGRPFLLLSPHTTPLARVGLAARVNALASRVPSQSSIRALSRPSRETEPAVAPITGVRFKNRVARASREPLSIAEMLGSDPGFCRVGGGRR